MAYAAIISRGIKSWPILKCSSERCVCAPQSLSAGTSTSPRLSVSLRVSVILSLLSADSARPAVYELRSLDGIEETSLEFHLGPESQRDVMTTSSTSVLEELDDRLQQEHW